MKVLIWSPFVNPGGGERLLHRLIEALTTSDTIDELGVALSRPSSQQMNFDHTSEGKVRLLEAPKARWRNWSHLSFFPKIQTALRDWSRERDRHRLESFLSKIAPDFDVLYCFWAQHEPYVHSSLPKIATIQDLTLIDFPEILGEDATALVRSEIKKWVQHSICVVSSRAMLQKLQSFFPAEAADVQIVRHAISPESKRSPLSPAKAPLLPERYLLWPSNITVHKNHHNLLIAFERWGRRADIPLMLVGQGTDSLAADYRAQDRQIIALRGLIKRLGLRKDADFFALGYVRDEELTMLIEHAWCVVMPSLAEGGGSFPVEEALSYGTPVACSDIAVMREHLSERSAKIAWFDPYCPDSIVTALDEMDANYDLYKQSAVAGIGDPRPSWESIAAQYASIFESALNRRQSK